MEQDPSTNRLRATARWAWRIVRIALILDLVLSALVVGGGFLGDWIHYERADYSAPTAVVLTLLYVFVRLLPFVIVPSALGLFVAPLLVRWYQWRAHGSRSMDR
jgi:hypothetical protein